MFRKMGVTARFVAAIVVATLAIQAGSGFVSLKKSRAAQQAQAERFTGLMHAMQADEESLLREELHGKQEALAGVLGEIAATYIIGYDFASLGQLADIAMQDDDLVFVAFTDAKGKALTQVQEQSGDGIEVFTHDVLFEGDKVGVMRIGLSDAHVREISTRLAGGIDGMVTEARQAQTRTALQLAAWTGGLTVLGLVLLVAVTWLLLSRIIIRPVAKVVADLGESSRNVQTSSQQVSRAGESLAEGTQSQAAALEETSAALEELASQTHQNARHSEEAARETGEAHAAAEHGREAMHRMGEAIEQIKASADETSRIVRTIDEIAFQTNLLAL
ncbi:MAG TPA: methyl-accepting chemotaxis protein, partial [Candidatus Krumholzibacteria bacterium]|nr:methyl-accepting chemotaxis protein [Candidatus Krumholzibacteria bacterium]